MLVTALALILDAALALSVWVSVLDGRLGRMPQPLLSDEVALESRSPAKRSTGVGRESSSIGGR